MTLPRALALLCALCIAGDVVAKAVRGASQLAIPPAGGLVEIPGAPLPPVPPDAVRTTIKWFEPGLGLLKLAGRTPMLARGYGYLATLYAAIKDDQRANLYFDLAQEILLGRDQNAADLAWVRNNRGLMQLRRDHYAEALQSFRAALEVLDPNRQDMLEPRIAVLGNLATGYSVLGDADHAERAYLDDLELMRREHRQQTAQGRIVRANLAVLYSGMGDYEASSALIEALLDEPSLASNLRLALLTDLGANLAAMRRFEEARERIEQALALTSEGTENRCLILMNLATAYGNNGDWTHAEQVARQALPLARRLYGEDSDIVAGVLAMLGSAALARGELEKAEELFSRGAPILSKYKGDRSVYVATLRVLALTAQRLGKDARAHELSVLALALSKKELAGILAFGSESQKLAFQKNALVYDQLANLGEPRLLADAVLATKGIVLDSMLAERAFIRANATAEDREVLDHMNELKLEIMRKIERDEDTTDLARALKTAETRLARKTSAHVPSAAETVTLDAIQGALHDGQALVEFIGYLELQDGGKQVPSYGALVIPPKGTPAWVPLGVASGVDPQIVALRDAFARSGVRGGQVKVEDLAAPILYELHDRLWAPVAAQLPPDTGTVFVSPDGLTSFIPWAALVDDQDRFVGERWCITQLASGRDLLRRETASSARTFVAFGNATEDLEGAAEEVRAIAGFAGQNGWTSTVRIGADATERELLLQRQPRILHLATHGGVLAASRANRMSHNPMYRGYVLLSGGNATLKKWEQGLAARSSSDGVLTAEEASVLDLRGTSLAVLSACETGLGEGRTGEGVMGLRRGFVLAGASHVMLSLWQVSDAATEQFMSAFYVDLFHGGDLEHAFHETQRELLARWRTESGSVSVAAFRAGAFVLTR